MHNCKIYFLVQKKVIKMTLNIIKIKCIAKNAFSAFKISYNSFIYLLFIKYFKKYTIKVQCYLNYLF